MSSTKFNEDFKNISKTSKIKIKTDIKWFEQKPKVTGDHVVKLPHDKEMELRKEAEQLLQADCKHYTNLQHKGSKRGDFSWIRIVLSKGALNDKLAAHTLLIQDSAAHNLTSLQSLVHMANSKGKREQLMSMDNLKDIFLGDVLPPYKLKPFVQLVGDIDEKDAKQRALQLMLAYYEDQVRQLYRSYVEAIEKITHDILPSTKSKAINTMYELIANSSEQEQYLLEKLVNKLGDPSSKVASHVAHVLKKLVTLNHPAMKDVVVTEVERVLFRPNITDKAQYYCMCFLQELMFNPGDHLLANKLIGIYFGFFKSSTAKGDVNNKMMSALLTAVARALPYSTLGTDILEKHMETFYKLIHFVNTNIVIQGLTLMYKVLETKGPGLLADRFYSVVYRSLLDPQLEVCSRLPMFLNLVYRCIKKDNSTRRALAFLRRLLQISMTSSPSFSASIMIIISESLKSQPRVKELFYSANPGLITESESEDTGVIDNRLEDEEKSKPKTSKKKINKDYQLDGRNPRHVNPHKTSIWEVPILEKHFHPSVALFGKNVSEKKRTQYDGDPLTDFTLKHFLDRFVFRNPKSIEKQDTLVARQATVFGRLNKKAKGKMLANSKEYINLPEHKIPIEERFIYQYLQDKPAFNVDKEDIDLESVASDDFERLLDKFENDFDDGDLDYAANFKQKRRKLEREINAEEDESASSEDNFDMNSDDEDIDFDNDDDYKAAFDGIEDELGGYNSDEISTKHIRRGRRKEVASLFESADKFAALLEANDDNEDESDDNEEL